MQTAGADPLEDAIRTKETLGDDYEQGTGTVIWLKSNLRDFARAADPVIGFSGLCDFIVFGDFFP